MTNEILKSFGKGFSKNREFKYQRKLEKLEKKNRNKATALEGLAVLAIVLGAGGVFSD